MTFPHTLPLKVRLGEFAVKSGFGQTNPTSDATNIFRL